MSELLIARIIVVAIALLALLLLKLIHWKRKNLDMLIPIFQFLALIPLLFGCVILIYTFSIGDPGDKPIEYLWNSVMVVVIKCYVIPLAIYLVLGSIAICGAVVNLVIEKIIKYFRTPNFE